MIKTQTPAEPAQRRPWYRPSLTTQILIGLVVGGLLGYISPKWGNNVYFLRDIFINLIKSIIAPLVFSTIVVGIAGAGALRKVGRMGIKGLIYFEIVTTVALVIGLTAINVSKAGVGVQMPSQAATQPVPAARPTPTDMILHIFQVPFYYIEYGIAQVGAIQVFANARRDQEADRGGERAERRGRGRPAVVGSHDQSGGRGRRPGGADRPSAGFDACCAPHRRECRQESSAAPGPPYARRAL